MDNIHTRKKGRILYRIKGVLVHNKWDKAILTFRYDDDYENCGEYSNLKDLERAYKAFSEVLAEF